jgi:hypothetical protein
MIAGPDPDYRISDRFDDPGRLVAKHNRQIGLVLALEKVQVTVAEP